MHTFTTDFGTYTITCELIPANDDRSAYWKIDVLHEGRRANDISYTIEQKEAEEILAQSGRDAVEELRRVAEADVVLGRNQLPQLPNPQAGIAFANFKRCHRSHLARQKAMKEFIRLLFPSLENPEDHQAQDRFNDRRERYASQCETEFQHGVLDFYLLEQNFKRFT